MQKIVKYAFAPIGLIAMAMLFISQKSNTATVGKDQISFKSRYHITTPPFPEKLSFAGENVPLDDWNVRERLERELLVNTYWQSSTVLMLKRTGRYFGEIEAILKLEGIPNDFKYLPLIESGLTNSVSPSGARGMWQFMSSTAEAYGLTVDTDIDERYHLAKSTLAACNYLKKAKNRTGSWTLAAAAFNRGLNGISRDLAKQKTSSYYDLYLNTETSRYIFRILALKLIVENPEVYGFSLANHEYYLPVPTYYVSVDTTITNLTDFAAEHGTNYRNLKLLNPWLRQDHLTVKERATYRLRLPEILAESADE